MIGGVEPTILVAIIGMPAALITAIGTVWIISRRGTPTSAAQDAESEFVTPRRNGSRYVTHDELRDVARELRGDMQQMETRQNSKLDLIVSLLKDR